MRFLWLIPALALGCSTATLKHPPEGGVEDDASVVEEDAGLPFPSTSKVKVIVEPSDNGAQLLNAIQNAQKSVHMTMYLLTSNQMMSALIGRKKAGLDVKVILNQTFPTMTDDNKPAYDQLIAGGVPVVWSSKAFNYAHAKCLIIDDAQAWIMTMNLTISSASSNREYLAVDTDPRDVQEAESVFAADYAGMTATPTGRLVLSPTNSRERLKALIALATQKLDVAFETLSDTDITSALIAAKSRGVAIRIVVDDQTGTQAMQNALMTLKQAGIPIVKLGKPSMHAKAMVADGVAAFVGSENLTMNSLNSNREIGVMIHGPEVGTVGQTIDADFKAGTPY